MKLGFDIIFLAAVAGASVGSFFLGDERTQRLMIGSLVGVFAATQLAPLIAKYTASVSVLTVTNISFILTAAVIVAFVVPRKLRDAKWPKNKPRAVIGGFLTALFLLGYSVGFLSEDTRTALVTDHNLAALSYDLRLFSLAALVIWLIVTIVIIGKAKK